jgi:hypothetical protein
MTHRTTINVVWCVIAGQSPGSTHPTKTLHAAGSRTCTQPRIGHAGAGGRTMTEADDDHPKRTFSTFHYSVLAALIAGAATAINRPKSVVDGISIFALVLVVILIRRLLF